MENSLDYDVRAGLGRQRPLFDDWRRRSDVRCDIHVLEGSTGRRLEVANVNATPVESRLRTDKIYYHHPTADDCTLDPRGGRVFGYERANRYLVGSEFTELVKLGLVGTVGTSVEQLRDFGLKRAHEGYSVMLGFEASDERRANGPYVSEPEARRRDPR
ncbi:hypothetical protein [Streptomyces misionensis]